LERERGGQQRRARAVGRYPPSVYLDEERRAAAPGFFSRIDRKQEVGWKALAGLRAEHDSTPCPPGRVTRLFAVIHQAATYTGTRKKGEVVVVWPTFKKYCQRTFLESPVRLEQAVNILVKLRLATLEMIPCETDPEAPDELGVRPLQRDRADPGILRLLS